MTYKESYMKCKTLQELEKEISSDISHALLFNPDRIKYIKATGEEVANIKFNNQKIEAGKHE